MSATAQPDRRHLAIGLGVLALAGLLAWGALDIPSDAGYAGVGPDFLPWVVAAVLAVCGGWLTLQAWRGGFADAGEPSGAAHGDWRSLAWVVAGIAVNAATLERIGFVAACALCYALAVRGLRLSEGRPGGAVGRTAADIAVGAAIAAPVFWLFTQVLGVNLPGLTATGWI